MRFDKTPLEKAARALMDKADNCLDIASAQHDAADKQHAGADKLEIVGHALEADAVRLKGDAELAASRTSPPLQEKPKADPGTWRFRNR